MLGGAALTRTYVERDLREVYDGRLFYGKDAFEGLHTMDTLMEGKRSRARSIPTSAARSAAATSRPASRRWKPSARSTAAAVRSDVAADVADLHAAVPRLARRQGHLARRHRRATSTRPRCSATSGSSVPTSRWARTTPSSRSASARRCAPSSTRRRPKAGWCPRWSWGYFPVNADGNDLIVWTDDDRRTERLRFTFPRQRSDRHLCIADFFRSRRVSGDADYAAFHVVTVGDARHASASASCSPPTATRSTSSPTACRSR